MERLTVKCDDGHWGLSLTVYDKAIPSRILEKVPIAIDRLAAYENTGLMPEEITAIKHALMGQEVAKVLEFDGIPIQRLQELAQAEKDSRLVVIPCKEGDPVWWINVDWLPGNGPMFYKIDSGKFRFAMLDWQNPIYTSQADAEAALAEMAKRDT